LFYLNYLLILRFNTFGDFKNPLFLSFLGLYLLFFKFLEPAKLYFVRAPYIQRFTLNFGFLFVCCKICVCISQRQFHYLIFLNFLKIFRKIPASKDYFREQKRIRFVSFSDEFTDGLFFPVYFGAKLFYDNLLFAGLFAKTLNFQASRTDGKSCFFYRCVQNRDIALKRDGFLRASVQNVLLLLYLRFKMLEFFLKLCAAFFHVLREGGEKRRCRKNRRQNNEQEKTLAHASHYSTTMRLAFCIRT